MFRLSFIALLIILGLVAALVTVSGALLSVSIVAIISQISLLVVLIVIALGLAVIGALIALRNPIVSALIARKFNLQLLPVVTPDAERSGAQHTDLNAPPLRNISDRSLPSSPVTIADHDRVVIDQDTLKDWGF